MWHQLVLALLSIELTLATFSPQVGSTQQATEEAARARARRAAQHDFEENFRAIQVVGIDLLKSHEDGTLDSQHLAKNTRAIQRHARALRGLMALGPPITKPQPIIQQIQSSETFDKAIRALAKLVADFAHSPIHKNPKVFDTDLAAHASTDIVVIVELAKLIERRAKDYAKP